MAASDAFALERSGLSPFLFAEVGTELNGSALTILSVLARLGQDPWAEAAKWTKLPKSTTVDRLAHSIAQMPLSSQAINDARSTAARLVLLLPSQVTRPAESQAANKVMRGLTMPKWILPAACGIAVALAVAYTTMGPERASTITPISDLSPARTQITPK